MKIGYCRLCNQRVLGKVDKSRPSERVEWKGENWTAANPTYMWMYPSLPPGDLCYYHEKKMEAEKKPLIKFQEALIKLKKKEGGI